MGIRVDILLKLVPKDPEKGLQQLIAFDQLTMRGEDLTRLIFANLPSGTRAATREEDRSQSESLVEGESESEGDGARRESAMQDR